VEAVAVMFPPVITTCPIDELPPLVYPDPIPVPVEAVATISPALTVIVLIPEKPLYHANPDPIPVP
jgi:hypothetical protein